jgi:hypothetical protein
MPLKNKNITPANGKKRMANINGSGSHSIPSNMPLIKTIALYGPLSTFLFNHFRQALSSIYQNAPSIFSEMRSLT